MGLTFAAATTDKVDVGSGATLDNLSPGTIITWCYPTDVGTYNRRIAVKQGTQPLAFLVADTAAGDLVLFYSRATTVLKVRTGTGVITVDNWQCLAATWDAAGVAADQKLYRGTLTTSLAELTYAEQGVGAGAHDDAAAVLVLGNRAGLSTPFIGRLAWVGIWNRALPLGELLDQQFHPHVTSGCVGFWHLGFAGTGTQPDWSGNGNAGTVTGATVGAHVPLGPVFGFDSMDAYLVAAAGRTTKNTDLRPLGLEAGMSRRFAA